MRRDLADTYTRPAGALQDPRTSIQQNGKHAGVEKLAQHLAAARADRQVNIRVYLSPLQDLGGSGYILIAAVGAAADEDAVGSHIRLPHGSHVVRHAWLGHKRLQQAQIKRQLVVVNRSIIRRDLDIILLPLLGAQEETGILI